MRHCEGRDMRCLWQHHQKHVSNLNIPTIHRAITWWNASYSLQTSTGTNSKHRLSGKHLTFSSKKFPWNEIFLNVAHALNCCANACNIWTSPSTRSCPIWLVDISNVFNVVERRLDIPVINPIHPLVPNTLLSRLSSLYSISRYLKTKKKWWIQTRCPYGINQNGA